MAFVQVLWLLSALGVQSPSPVKYTIDGDHSSIGFAIRFMGLTTIRGAFTEYVGTIMYTERDPSRSSASVVIATKSINTNSEQRDIDLKSPNFFDAVKFPFITFRTTRVTPTAHGVALDGPLTIHGISKEVTIACTRLHNAMSDAWGNTRVGFLGTLRINRKDFGVDGIAFWNSQFDPGRMAIGDTVEIELSIEGLRPNYDRWNTPGADSLVKIVLRDGVSRVSPPVMHEGDKPDASGSAFAVAGLKLLGKGRAADGVRLLEIASQLVPRSTDILTMLGDARQAAGDLRGAISTFEQVQTLDSNSTSAQESLRWLRP
jgi:polyisoprenoid-binding protein YceI